MININNIFLKKNYEYYVYIFFIFIYPFLFIRYGLDYTDSPFQYLGYIWNGQGFEYFKFTFFSIFIGKLFVSLFGDSIIYFRIIATIISIISIIIPVSVFIRRNYILKKKLRHIAISIIFYTTSSAYIFDYDNISLFFLSLLTTGFLIYLREGGCLILVLIGILTALLVSSRFPSIVVLFPILSTLIFQSYLKKKSLKESIFLIACYIITFSIVFFALRSLFITSETLEPQLGESHTLSNILISELRDGIIIFHMIAVLSFFATGYHKLKKLSIPENYIYTTLPIIFIIYLYIYVIKTSYNLNISLFYSSFTLWALLLLLYNAYQKDNKDDITMYLFFI